MEKNLAELTQIISNDLLESMAYISVMHENMDLDCRYGTMMTVLENKVEQAFHNIETCRKIISRPID